MALSKIIKTTNANVYLNGTALIGKAEEVTLPNIKPLFVEFKPLGMQGAVELPSGFETMEFKIKFNAIYDDVYQQVVNFNTVNNYMVRIPRVEHSVAGGVKETNMMVMVSGISKEVPLGGYKQNEMVDGLELTTTVQSLTVEINGAPTVEIDVISNVYRVGKSDLLKVFRGLI